MKINKIVVVRESAWDSVHLWGGVVDELPLKYINMVLIVEEGRVAVNQTC